ncbi:NADPH-dependent 2,4-dienoyl-CoA reductase/sulfur reductase-like enzyme [Polymorphobacter multimanifer]|uniref:NADPH-dependent 2,4-dienoyl-CoA reductase/sulfur reductase-like enzyme n=1 Tax=Polymorphobacter multimanifer TaxID=1070431 RepID=A0A841L9Y9_9SPHN|nr:FAD-dependent oxidoreductase [Polymorphobacter multimanifer]MBB6227783.1 NADPH-dependent 2,4-dienoyl-CoA reductase/sulfur reductase-like enzyme [Polymorphobacter multimanifer]
MRVEQAGISRGAAFDFRFEGRAVTGYAGESIAAALISAGEAGLRETAGGGRRGVFCGMGVCGECMVLADGVPVRGCMTGVRPGMDVQPAPARAVAHAEPQVAAQVELFPDLLVIGAGPAGLAAASAAAAAGLDVLVVDERGQAGGQYFKQPGKGFGIERRRLDAQFAEGAALAESAVLAGAEFRFGTSVWAAALVDGALCIDLSAAGSTQRVRPKRLVIATGAYERPMAFPGWTLPGVMTTGAAQTLLRAYQTSPGKRVLVAGNGPLNLQVAQELVRSGVEVVAVVESAAAPGPRHAGQILQMVATAPGLVADGVRHVAALRLAGVRMLHGQVVAEARGEGRVDEVVLSGGQRFAVDALCLGYGFVPQAEIARALGVREGVRDGDGRSSIADVFIAGDGGGLGGARVALAQGLLAGAAAAADLGWPVPPAEIARARRDLVRHRRFQDALWQLYAPVVPAPRPTAETVICRCESVTAGVVEGHLGAGMGDLGSIKRMCRVGMGRCQGRYCSVLVADVLAAHGHVPDEPGFAPRPPFKPVTIGAVAGNSANNRSTSAQVS